MAFRTAANEAFVRSALRNATEGVPYMGRNATEGVPYTDRNAAEGVPYTDRNATEGVPYIDRNATEGVPYKIECQHGLVAMVQGF